MQCTLPNIRADSNTRGRAVTAAHDTAPGCPCILVSLCSAHQHHAVLRCSHAEVAAPSASCLQPLPPSCCWATPARVAAASALSTQHAHHLHLTQWSQRTLVGNEVLRPSTSGRQHCARSCYDNAIQPVGSAASCAMLGARDSSCCW
jgi:hypothetical protein